MAQVLRGRLQRARVDLGIEAGRLDAGGQQTPDLRGDVLVQRGRDDAAGLSLEDVGDVTALAGDLLDGGLPLAVLRVPHRGAIAFSPQLPDGSTGRATCRDRTVQSV